MVALFPTPGDGNLPLALITGVLDDIIDTPNTQPILLLELDHGTFEGVVLAKPDA